jgi:hypothetical protein
MIFTNMRTLSTQVRLRRLIRAFTESLERLLAEPADRQLTSSFVLRLQELAEGVRESWDRESALGPSEPSLERFGNESLRTIDLAIMGLGQAGADLRLLQRDFEDAALPLELFLRGLDVQPALQRSA